MHYTRNLPILRVTLIVFNVWGFRVAILNIASVLLNVRIRVESNFKFQFSQTLRNTARWHRLSLSMFKTYVIFLWEVQELVKYKQIRKYCIIVWSSGFCMAPIGGRINFGEAFILSLIPDFIGRNNGQQIVLFGQKIFIAVSRRSFFRYL